MSTGWTTDCLREQYTTDLWEEKLRYLNEGGQISSVRSIMWHYRRRRNAPFCVYKHRLKKIKLLKFKFIIYETGRPVNLRLTVHLIWVYKALHETSHFTSLFIMLCNKYKWTAKFGYKAHIIFFYYQILNHASEILGSKIKIYDSAIRPLIITHCDVAIYGWKKQEEIIHP